MQPSDPEGPTIDSLQKQCSRHNWRERAAAWREHLAELHCEPVEKITGASRADGYVPTNLIPPALVQATCEMARQLLIADRTAPPPGEGIASTYTTNTGGTTYSKSDTPPILTQVTQALLAKYGTLLTSRTAQVRLIRV